MIGRVIWGIIGLLIGVVGWGLVGMDISDINTYEFWGVSLVSVSSYILTTATLGD